MKPLEKVSGESVQLLHLISLSLPGWSWFQTIILESQREACSSWKGKPRAVQQDETDRGRKQRACVFQLVPNIWASACVGMSLSLKNVLQNAETGSLHQADWHRPVRLN